MAGRGGSIIEPVNHCGSPEHSSVGELGGRVVQTTPQSYPSEGEEAQVFIHHPWLVIELRSTVTPRHL